MRVVSTKLEYTTSLGQVLPWGATWAPLEGIPVVGKWYTRLTLGVILCWEEPRLEVLWWHGKWKP